MINQVGQFQAPNLEVDLVALLEGGKIDEKVRVIQQKEFQRRFLEVEPAQVDLSEASDGPAGIMSLLSLLQSDARLDSYYSSNMASLTYLS